MAFIAVIISIVTLIYYFNSLTPVLFGKDKAQAGSERKAISIMMAIPMIILALISMASFVMLLPNAGNVLLRDAVTVLTGGNNYAAIVLGAIK